MIALKDNISRLAREKKLTLCQIEKKAKLSKGSISKWNTVKPSIDKVLKVAAILDCNVDTFFKVKQKGESGKEQVNKS